MASPRQTAATHEQRNMNEIGVVDAPVLLCFSLHYPSTITLSL